MFNSISTAILMANIIEFAWFFRFLLSRLMRPKNSKRLSTSVYYATIIEVLVFTLICGGLRILIYYLGMSSPVYTFSILGSAVLIIGVYLIISFVSLLVCASIDTFNYHRHINKRQIEMGTHMSKEDMAEAEKKINDKLNKE